MKTLHQKLCNQKIKTLKSNLIYIKFINVSILKPLTNVLRAFVNEIFFFSWLLRGWRLHVIMLRPMLSNMNTGLVILTFLLFLIDKSLGYFLKLKSKTW